MCQKHVRRACRRESRRINNTPSVNFFFRIYIYIYNNLERWLLKKENDEDKNDDDDENLPIRNAK